MQGKGQAKRMDKTVIAEHIKIIDKHYPGMNIMQLGMVITLLGVLRATMGHEHAKGTVENYIHYENLSPGIRQCLDFIQREILGIKKSKIDIDYWKRGNKGQFRSE